jgi:hypothetical protein
MSSRSGDDATAPAVVLVAAAATAAPATAAAAAAAPAAQAGGWQRLQRLAAGQAGAAAAAAAAPATTAAAAAAAPAAQAATAQAAAAAAAAAAPGGGARCTGARPAWPLDYSGSWLRPLDYNTERRQYYCRLCDRWFDPSALSHDYRLIHGASAGRLCPRHGYPVTHPLPLPGGPGAFRCGPGAGGEPRQYDFPGVPVTPPLPKWGSGAGREPRQYGLPEAVTPPLPPPGGGAGHEPPLPPPPLPPAVAPPTAAEALAATFIDNLVGALSDQLINTTMPRRRSRSTARPKKQLPRPSGYYPAGHPRPSPGPRILTDDETRALSDEMADPEEEDDEKTETYRRTEDDDEDEGGNSVAAASYRQ